ncbi:MAG: T9SS type A sorting domain-containing protein [Bacteroidetes bacterium]|nr:T9SS type A sorting domain-containing protein [Bacteroidota bacterium]
MKILSTLAFLCLFQIYNFAQSWKSFNILSGNPTGHANEIRFLDGITGCYGSSIALTNGVPAGNTNLPYGAAFDPTEGKLYYSKPGITAGSSVFNVYNNSGSVASNNNISTINGGEFFRMGVGQDGNVYGTITATVTTISGSSPRIDIKTVKLTRYNPETNIFTVLGNIQCPAAYASTMPAPYNDGNYWSSSNASSTPYYAAQLGHAGYGDLVIAPDNTLYMTIGKKLITIPNYSSVNGTTLIPCIEVGNILPAGVGYNFSGEGKGTYGLSWDYNNNNLLVISSRSSDGADGSYNVSPADASIAGTFRVNCLSNPINANFADLTEIFSSIGCANQISAIQYLGYNNQYRIAYQVRVENIGASVLKNVQVTEDLQHTFALLNLSNISTSFVSNPAGLVLNNAYNGTTNTNLLDGTKTLYGKLYKGINLNGGSGNIAPASNYAIINITVDVAGISTAGSLYSNSAVASGSAFDGSQISDSSHNGSTVEGLVVNDKADDSDENDATIIKFGSTVSGTIWNDIDGSAGGTFNNIRNNGENGTNAAGIFAVLTDPASGNVIASTPVAANGSYNFTNVPSFANLQVRLTNTAGTAGSLPPAEGITSDWAATSPLHTNTTGDINTGTYNPAEPLRFGAIDDVNNDFGMERLPESAFNIQPAIGNPGGFNSYQVTPSAFFVNNSGTAPNTTDYDGGIVTGVRITAFPSNTNSITINGIAYTNGGSCAPAGNCTPWPANGVLVPFSNNTGIVPSISIDPAEGNVNVTISFAAVDNAGKEDSTPGSVTIPFKTIVVSGMVWDDANGNLYLTPGEGLIDGTNLTAGINTGAALYMNLLDSNNKVLAVVPLQSSGTYTFPNVPQNANGITIQLSKNQGTVGMPKPITQLPEGWVNTGEQKYGRAGGNDTIPDGQIHMITASANITSMDFGIEALPTTSAQSYVIPTPAINGTLVLNGNGTSGSPAACSGNDYEDGSLVQGSTFVITNIAGMAGNKLLYNGNEITGASTISNYNPALLKVQFTNLSSIVLSFKYRAKDAAGKTAAADASYTVIWAYILPVQKFSAAATLSGNTVNIQWQTENESNTKTFVVERSTAADFTSISEQPAAGSSTGSRFYNSTDNLQEFQHAAVIYYRVKLVDQLGKVTYSNTIAIKVSQDFTVNFWPNPFTDVINVALTSKEATTAILSLIDTQGKTVYQYSAAIIKGSNQLRINNTAILPKGIYILRLSDKTGNINYTQKIQKQ